jgi:glycosyltransferase involved in cell wall biosynthesis
MSIMKQAKIRVLHILVCLGSGGVETLLLRWYKKIPNNIHFDFLVLHKEIHDKYVEERGSLLHVLPKNIAYKPWKHSEYVEFLVSKYGYDVVHFHRFAFGGSIMKRLKRCGVSKRIVHSRHTMFQDKSFFKRALYYPYHYIFNRLFLLKYATHILACSNDAGIFLMGPFWKYLSKCVFLPNGVPIEEFRELMSGSDKKKLCARYGIPFDAIVVGHFGRLESVKNQKLLLDAFADLSKRDSRYWLFIGGDGNLREYLSSYALKLGISDRLCMPGYCANAPELYGSLFDVFCLPSIAEGFGNVIIEATAAGLFSVISDIITKDITDTFAERVRTVSLKADPTEWANALEYGVSKKMSQEDGIRIIQNSPFTLDSQLNSLVEIYSRFDTNSV